MNNTDKWFAKQLKDEKILMKKLKSFKRAYKAIEETQNSPQFDILNHNNKRGK